MKVAIGEMKTHLSRYIRELQGGAEPIEVCVRERTVAYLSAPDTKIDRANGKDLLRAFETDGLQVSQWGRKLGRPLPPVSGPRGESNSVVGMRQARDW